MRFSGKQISVPDIKRYLWDPAVLTGRARRMADCLKIFPRMMAAVVAMIVMCGLLSMLLAALVPNTDPLTAYLSMTPGGMDTAVVIAATTNVSLPLVLAAQMVRLIIVMIAGPSMAKAVAGWQRRTA
jgi:uncharacterized membrane protein AbrB (regulator of aidB expression)